MPIAATPVLLITQEDKYGDLGYGYLSDYIMESAKAGGLDPEIKFYPPKRAVYQFINDDVAFCIGNPKHIVDFDFDKSTIGYVPLVKAQFLLHYYKPSHPDGIEFNTIADLDGYKISIHRGSPSVVFYRERGLNFVEYNDPRSGFDMLKNGRLDLVEAAQVVGAQVILNDFSNEYENFTFISKPTQSIETGLIYKLNNNEAIELMNSFKQGLRRVKSSGKVEEILQKYFGSSVPDVLAHD